MSYTHRACGKTLSNTAQHCAECHETFVGTSAGDAHRVGPHETGRRCLTVEEILAHKKQFWRDERGYWHMGARDPRWDAPDYSSVPRESDSECPEIPRQGSDESEGSNREIGDCWPGHDR